MPKPLTKEPASSSVANMLDPNVAAAALRPPANLDIQLPTPIADQLPKVLKKEELPTGEPANLLRQYSLTPSAEETLHGLVLVYSKASGLNLKTSELLRAILTALRHAMPELEREAQQVGRLKRPKNERGNEARRDEFERQIARAIVSGMRAAKTME